MDVDQEQCPPPPQRRKVNNIWMKLAEEEQLNATLSGLSEMGVAADPGRIKVDRGPETYYIDKRVYEQLRNSGRKRKAPGDAEDEKAKSEDESGDSDSSLSSGGLSDGEMQMLKRRKGPQFKRSLKRKKEIKVAKKGGEDSVQDETVLDFVQRLGTNLRERNTDLLRKVVEHVGIPVANNLMRKVLKIENLGGIMVKDGSRRRAPGGVFFYLIQRHPETASPELKRLINTKPTAKDQILKVSS